MAERLIEIETDEERFAARVESRVIEGKKQVLNSEERKRLREAVEGCGLDLRVFDIEAMDRVSRIADGAGRSSRQAREMEIVFGGRETLVDYCQEMLFRCVSEHRREEAVGYVEKYFREHTTQDGYLHFSKGEDLLKNRLEAIISATHSMMELIAQSNDQMVDVFVKGDEFNHCLRERVLRGWEKTKKVVVPLNREVPRKVDNIIRTLPVGALKKMVEYFIVRR